MELGIKNKMAKQEEQKIYYVTHIDLQDSNSFREGYDQLFFYTTLDQTLNSGKYFFGKGNTSYNQEQIDDFVNRGLIKKLESKVYPLPLNDKRTLWFDKTGTVYEGDLYNPELPKQKICIVEELKKE